MNHVDQLKKLQLKMLRIQQGLYQANGRAMILFEGFDAAGKGGAIRRLTEGLDPRGVRVHEFGPPSAEEQGKHYLYRFWEVLPAPGQIAVFDRTWYGRVLVERVEKLIPKKRWKEAFEEILWTEKILRQDGIYLVKIFLAISPETQLERFQERLNDPYKQWKLTEDDVRARRHWREYEKAVAEMLKKTDKKVSPWHVIAADHKDQARVKVLETVTGQLRDFGKWMEEKAAKHEAVKLKKELKHLKI